MQETRLRKRDKDGKIVRPNRPSSYLPDPPTSFQEDIPLPDWAEEYESDYNSDENFQSEE